MWGVPLSAGLPCGARAEVVPDNSLRGLTAASFKQLRQVCQRCALRAPTSTLCFSAPTRRPARAHPRPLGAPLGVPRARDPGTPPAGQKSRVGGWRGACVGVAGTQAGPGLPLASGKGMASMFEAAGRVAQPPGPDQCRRAVPRRGTAHMKPCQSPTRLRPALPRQNAPKAPVVLPLAPPPLRPSSRFSDVDVNASQVMAASPVGEVATTIRTYASTMAMASATRSTLLTFRPAAHIRPERNTYTPCVSRSTSACAALKPV